MTFKKNQQNVSKLQRFLRACTKKLIKIGKIPNDIQKNWSSGPSGDLARHIRGTFVRQRAGPPSGHC